MAESFGWVDGYQLVHPQKRAFLYAYAMGKTIGQACDDVGIGRQTHYGWLNREHDEQEAYTKAWADAQERRFEVLEREARRRAVEGVESTLIGKDGQSYTKIEYSDTLLIFLMKGAHPEIYRDNIRHEHSGAITLESLLTATGASKPQ